MRYIIYTRVSDEKQETDYQEKECIDYVHSVGGARYLLFSDPYKSGKSRKNRPNLEVMLKTLHKGDIVIVFKLDRLSRDIVDMVTIYREILSKGASIKSLKDPYSDEFSVSILGIFAQREREDTCIKTKAKLKYKAAMNQRYSRLIPYGYYLDNNTLIPIKREGKIVNLPGNLLPHEKEQEVLNMMCEYFDAGCSYGVVAKRLTDQGLMNREGKPFQKMSIYRILLRSGRKREPALSLEDLECHSIP